MTVCGNFSGKEHCCSVPGYFLPNTEENRERFVAGDGGSTEGGEASF